MQEAPVNTISTINGNSGIRRRAMAGAISAVVAGTGSPLVLAQNPGGIEEVIVSARKRDENMQDIPQAIIAFRPEDIVKQGIRSLDDVAKFAPALTVVGSTAGLNKIVFRGLADSVRPFIADSSAAIYLDELPLTTGAQSPEVRPIDLERIETLAGPQGTLYGASSQSGTVRYIVAKPDVSAFTANVGGGLHGVDDGEGGWDADAMINVPIIKDKLALRLVGFGAKDAGYIDNVLGSTPYAGTKTNADKVDKDINSADWAGGRAAVKWQVNDNWSLTGIYNYQNSTINGFNDYDPTQGDLKTVKFNDESWDDEWEAYQFTIEGDLGFAQLTSSTSYFERDTAYVFDGTSGVSYYHSVLGFYGRGNCATDPGMAYYNIYDFSTACELNGSGFDIDDGDPTGFYRNDQKDKRWAHETRLSGTTSRLDWTLGFFYQDADQHWKYGTHIENYERTESFAAYQVIHGPIAPTDIRWSSSEKNTREDMALFGETTWSINEQWKLLLGARWYKTDVERTYTLRVPDTGPPDISKPSGDDDGVLPKIGLQYYFDDERMFYALYSEGFRTGGINRARGTPTLPIQYESDILLNYEAGFKTRWMDNRLQVNASFYHQVWEDMQLELTDPSWQFGEPFQTVVANVGDAIVDGVDIDLTFVPGGGLTFGLVSTYLFKAEIDDDIQVADDRAPNDLALDIEAGTRLPLAADLNVSAYAEYSWPLELLGGGDAYVRLQYSYTDGSWNRLIDNDGCQVCDDYGGRVRQTDYDVWDIRAGYTATDWEFSFYVDNLADQRIINYNDTNADVFWGRKNIRTSNPRTAGMSVRKFFR